MSSSWRSPSSAPRLNAAARIGHRYEVIEELGRGGTAGVYRVRDKSRGEELALKQLVPTGSARDRELRTQFEREYYVLSQLSHPSVVQVHDFGVDPAGPYYTMELLDSGDLSSHAPWPYAAACQIMVQMCSALALLHSRQLVHRDVTPRNIRCTQHGIAKLIDFGAMVPMGPCLQSVGTPGFVAPEVVHRVALDARADLFSLGATLYYALTGCRPFAARTLAELADAWRQAPAPPGTLVAGIPSALDELVLSLLRVDPDRRPNSAFEVMQRLAAIADITLAESTEISRAYLATPPLVGRELQQRRFTQCLRRAVQAEQAAGGLIFEGASGLGRTRLLDACMLEAKTTGATVLRFAGRAARPEAFACAHRLAEQLIEALPEQAVTWAAEAGVLPTLFRSSETGSSADIDTCLHSVESMGAAVYAVQSALLAWLLRVAESQPIVIAVDDIERIDEASLAWLVMLVHGAGNARLLLVSTLCTPSDAAALPALAVLQTLCSALPLLPLSADQTDSLFTSVFANAHGASFVSAWIQQLAAGNPRDALALAQYLLDRRLIRYADGNWALPAEFAMSDLPASAEDALRIQLAGLAELPRRLAEAQAVAMDAPWSRADYHLLAATDTAARVDEAIAVLLRHGVIVDNAGAFTLSHLGMRVCLITQLTAAERVSHELALAALCVRSGRPALVEVHHLLQGEQFERGLARLASLLDEKSSASSLRDQFGVDFRFIAHVIERAHDFSAAHGGNRRTTHRLARILLELSLRTEIKLYYRHAGPWLAQLERDSGLADFRLADPSIEAPLRLQHAMQAAGARYAATAKTQRVYRVDEAIQQLAYYVAASTVIGGRTLDTELLSSLPSVLEPFAAMSPALHALWQTACVTNELVTYGRTEQARLHYLEIYRRIKQLSTTDVPYLATMLPAIVAQAARAEVTLGYRTAEDWISLMEQDALQRGTAQYLRRVLCIYDGDTAGAERCRKEAEVLSLQSRQMFEAPLSIELFLQIHLGDLTGVKQVADRIAQLASEWPGWRAYHYLAQGSFHRMRGDLAAARTAFAQMLALSDPDQTAPPPLLRPWSLGAAEYISVLADSGQLEEARDFGLEVCGRCDALGVSEGHAHVRELALVEAKLGEHELAAGRVDRLIAQRTHLRPSVVAIDLEARARIAIIAKDAQAAAHFTQLAMRTTAALSGSHMLAKRGRLLDEAKRAGLDLDVPMSGFESAVLGSRSALPSVVTPRHVLASVEQLAEPSVRADRVLELLMESAGAEAGHLYYVQQATLVWAATRCVALDAAVERFAVVHLQQWRKHSAMTTVFTEVSDSAEPRFAIWLDDRATEYCVALLHGNDTSSCVGLVALRGVRRATMSAEYRSLSTSISDLLLSLGDVRRIGAHGGLS